MTVGPADAGAVVVRELVKRYPKREVNAVDGLSFEVGRGEIFGLLGPNGAGKTTAIRVVTTLLRPNAGTMEVFGLDTRRSTMRVRRLVGYVPQQRLADRGTPLRARDFVGLGLDGHRFGLPLPSWP